jgi:hypothetical protein
MKREDIIMLSFFTGTALLGAAATIAIEKAVTKYGHVFQHYQSYAQLGVKNAALLGVIGSIQTCASLFFGILLFKAYDKSAIRIAKLVFAHTITAGTLVGLTALAAKTNLFANRLTLFAGIALLANSLIINLSSLYILRTLD